MARAGCGRVGPVDRRGATPEAASIVIEVIERFRLC
jgi:hypothetical protein